MRNVRVGAEREVTINDLIKEADAIWRKARAAGERTSDIKAIAELIATVRREHPQFCKSYPIVMRYMCELRWYDASTFAAHIKHLRANPAQSEDAWLQLQADYGVALVKKRRKFVPESELNKLRTEILNSLRNENAEFKEQVTLCEKRVDKRMGILKNLSDEELKDFARACGIEGMKFAGTTRTVTDVMSGDAPSVEDLIEQQKITVEPSFGISADDLM